MTKLTVLLFCSLFFFTNCQKGKIEKQKVNNSNKEVVKIDSLKIIYKEIKEKKDNQQLNNSFLKLFPHNYAQFVKVFGYNDIKEQPAPLYSDSYSYINLFFKLSSDNPVYQKKAFDIAIDAKWEPDAENFFQKKLRTLITSNPQKVCSILSQYTYQQEEHIWHYIFDGPNNKENSNIKSLILTNCTNKQTQNILDKNLKSLSQDQSDPEQLKKNMEQRGYSLLTEKVCDLNQDNNQDYILIFEQKNTDNLVGDFIYESPVYVMISDNEKKFNIYKNSKIILTSNRVCPSNGFQKLVVKNNFFTIEEDDCSGHFFVNSFITFKYDKTQKQLITLHKLGKQFSDRTNPDKIIPDKIQTVKDFGNIPFVDFDAYSFGQ